MAGVYRSLADVKGRLAVGKPRVYVVKTPLAGGRLVPWDN
jgi:hypothetical protein